MSKYREEDYFNAGNIKTQQKKRKQILELPISRITY